MTQIIDKSGLAQEVSLSLEDYKAAAHQGKSLPQYLNSKFDTDATRYGTPFEQAMASNGMFLRQDKLTGLKPPSMRDVLEGSVDINLGPIVRPDGSQAQTLTGRLLFPAVILEMVESELRANTSSYEGTFNRMVATTLSVDSPRVDQPVINLTAPRAVRSQPISQLSEPPSMVSITLSEKSFRLPTHSIGIEWSQEAASTATLDLVGIALREQALAERVAMLDESLQKMVNGDTDLGMSALSSVTAASFDSSIVAAGNITRKAWLSYLHKDWKYKTIDWVICDLTTYMALEGVISYVTGSNSVNLNALLSLANPAIPSSVNVFKVDTGLLGANTIVGIDSSKAIRKVINTSATYQAVEEFVLRKSAALRIDFSEGHFRLLDQGWSKMTLTV